LKHLTAVVLFFTLRYKHMLYFKESRLAPQDTRQPYKNKEPDYNRTFCIKTKKLL
jgi:hypothetical protein